MITQTQPLTSPLPYIPLAFEYSEKLRTQTGLTLDGLVGSLAVFALTEGDWVKKLLTGALALGVHTLIHPHIIETAPANSLKTLQASFPSIPVDGVVVGVLVAMFGGLAPTVGWGIGHFALHEAVQDHTGQNAADKEVN